MLFTDSSTITLLTAIIFVVILNWITLSGGSSIATDTRLNAPPSHWLSDWRTDREWRKTIILQLKYWVNESPDTCHTFSSKHHTIEALPTLPSSPGLFCRTVWSRNMVQISNETLRHGHELQQENCLRPCLSVVVVLVVIFLWRMDEWREDMSRWGGKRFNPTDRPTNPLPDLRYQSTASYQCTNTNCGTYGTARTRRLEEKEEGWEEK